MALSSGMKTLARMIRDFLAGIAKQELRAGCPRSLGAPAGAPGYPRRSQDATSSTGGSEHYSLPLSARIHVGHPVPPERGIEGVRPRVLAPFVAIHEYLRLEVVGLAMLLAATSLSAATKSPLADAAERKDRAAVRSLLKQKVDVNVPQVDGMTALHWAAYQDDTETGKLLLDAGANVKAENRYGVTPLSLACQNGNTALVELLLSAGADPNTIAPWRGDGVDDCRTHREDRTGQSPPCTRGQSGLEGTARADSLDVGCSGGTCRSG